jgi:hypothetical protein
MNFSSVKIAHYHLPSGHTLSVKEVITTKRHPHELQTSSFLKEQELQTFSRAALVSSLAISSSPS